MYSGINRIIISDNSLHVGIIYYVSDGEIWKMQISYPFSSHRREKANGVEFSTIPTHQKSRNNPIVRRASLFREVRFGCSSGGRQLTPLILGSLRDVDGQVKSNIL